MVLYSLGNCGYLYQWEHLLSPSSYPASHCGSGCRRLVMPHSSDVCACFWGILSTQASVFCLSKTGEVTAGPLADMYRVAGTHLCHLGYEDAAAARDGVSSRRCHQPGQLSTPRMASRVGTSQSFGSAAHQCTHSKCPCGPTDAKKFLQQMPDSSLFLQVCLQGRLQKVLLPLLLCRPKGLLSGGQK